MTETMTDYEEHILVCLSPSPSNPKIIRAAGEMAKVYHGRLTALYLKIAEYSHLQGMFVPKRGRFKATLRKKLEKGSKEKQYIQTHVGIGYRMLQV